MTSSEVDIALVEYLKGGNLIEEMVLRCDVIEGNPSDAVRFIQKIAGLTARFALLFPGPSPSVKK